MTGKPRTSSRSCGSEQSEREAATGQSIKKVKCGDLVWVQLRRSSWWPGQVVDESTVSAGNRPRKKNVGEVLVRLYGSYEYLYLDPIKSSMEFEHVLKRYNGEYTNLLKEVLEEDLHQLKSNKKRMKTNGKTGADPSRGGISKSKETNKSQNLRLSSAEKSSRRSSASGGSPKPSGKRDHAPESASEHQENNKKQRYSSAQNNLSLRSPNSAERNEETTRKTSQRRFKVMRALGLIAPVGSPFSLEGCISSTSLLD